MDYSLLCLLQLASPALPVGAYSYSEGLEWLVQAGHLNSAEALQTWIEQELRVGTIRVDGAIALRAYDAVIQADTSTLIAWNHWLSAARDTEELRSQSLQMGRSLLRLWWDLDQPNRVDVAPELRRLHTEGCHFAIAYGWVAAQWQIERRSALLAYLHSWVSNLISAGVKLIPLGQTAGQQCLLNLQPAIVAAGDRILILSDEEFASCSWGVSLASMNHETQYSRLFRS